MLLFFFFVLFLRHYLTQSLCQGTALHCTTASADTAEQSLTHAGVTAASERVHDL